jgi:glutamate racemase
LIRPEIEQYYKGRAIIFDSALIVANYIKWVLDEKNLLNNGKPKKHRFYISDYTESFGQSTKLFFKGKISLEQKNLWK